MTGLIDIQKLFEIPDAAKEDREKGEEAVKAMQTSGGMSALLAPAAQRNAAAGFGRMLGVDLRSEKEQLKEQLQNMGTPQTEAEHVAYANVLDKIQPGAGLQYQIARAQEQRAERATVVQERQATTQEGNLAAREAEGDEQRRFNNERIRIDSMNLVRNLEADKKPDIRQAGNKVVAITTDADGKPVVETIFDGSTSTTMNSAQVAALTQAASRKYSNDPEGFSAITANILSGNITDAKQFEDYVGIPARGQMLGTMRTISAANANENQQAMASLNRIYDATDKLVEFGIMDETGRVNENLRTTGGLATLSVEGFLDLAGMRDEISYLRTAFTRERNEDIVGNLPPGVASDRDISIFAAGFPGDDAGMEEIALYFEQARYVQEQRADYARMREAMWEAQMARGENASDADTATAWQDYNRAMNSGVIDQMINEASPENRGVVLQAVKEEYGILPYKYRR